MPRAFYNDIDAKELLEDLALNEGFVLGSMGKFSPDIAALIAANLSAPLVAGICCDPGCGATAPVTAQAVNGICPQCDNFSIISCHMLHEECVSRGLLK